MQILLLIDAHALIHRFFHALPPLTTPRGEPIGAVYGLAGVILKILREKKPIYAAAAFDRPEETFRKEQYKEYKLHRPPAPDALISQFAEARVVFRKFRIPVFERAGFEADDLIGTLAERYRNEPGLQISILSGDLDLLQLVAGEKIIAELIKSGVGNTDSYTEARVFERYGISPGQLPDYKGLVGDASDNIPGVRGVGAKTAGELLKEFKTLEGIYENLAIIKPATAHKLEENREAAYLSRELATIRRDALVQTPPLSELTCAPLEKEALADYFSRLGFTSLISRLSE
jgi:DNA polymerase I